MNFKIPKTFMGVPVNEKTLEEVLGGKKDKPKKEEPQPQTLTTSGARINNPADYILLPARVPTKGNTKGGYPVLFVHVETRYHGLNWEDTQLTLDQFGAQMLTIRQFVDFLNLLKSGSAVDGWGRAVGKTTLYRIFDEITQVRNPWRGEWLDAQFEYGRLGHSVGSKMHIRYGHEVNAKGELVAGYVKEIESYLTSDKDPGIDINDWLSTINQHGLPQGNVADGQVYYRHPRNGKVAWFVADSDWAGLYCNGDPSGANSSLGVRPVRKKLEE